jgi:protein-S-isoprenylcysteine O-methyltransferase Ste14
LIAFIERWIGTFWLALWILWWVLAFTSKRTVQRQTDSSRYFQSGLALIGLWFIFNFGNYFKHGLLAARIIPHTAPWILIGAALAVAGVLIALWARTTLGANWSARVTIKQNHELIIRGPYAFVRHPIYTGLLTGMLGTALVYGYARCFIGVLICVLAFWLKSQTEEQFMIQQFGNQYTQYRQRVRALVPFVL